MKRLTFFKNGKWWIRLDGHLYGDFPAVDRLAAYEDTGLEPEEIMELCSMSERAKMADMLRLEEYQELGSIDHLRELDQAEKDGRLVVLPETSELDRKSFVDGLRDYFQEASYCDCSTGIFGMSEGEKELASVLMNALTREESEAAASL